MTQSNPLLARLYRHNLHPEDLAEATGYSLRYIFSVLTGKHNTPYAVAKLNRAIDIVLKNRK